jgi:hypothetical protein
MMPKTGRRFSALGLLRLLAIGAAVLAAIVPPAPAWVERLYADGIYPGLQNTLTSWSNLTRAPLFDLTVAAMIIVLIACWAIAWRAARRQRSIRPALSAAVQTITLLALAYLWFLLAWGLNYRRPALEATIAFDSARITPDAVRELAELAVARVNHLHAAAHRAGFPPIDGVPDALLASLHDVERSLGRPRPTLPAQPKWSLQSPFFRAAGVSGMLAPFFLETYVNPDLTPPERPYVLAHEWAHLAGHAPEADASFVGTLAALGADVPAQYSAWLELVSEAVSQLQPVTQRLVLEKLAEGPRRDQDDVRRRLRALVQPVQRASWATYDRMLKSQGVEEGIRSYSRVIQLLIGSDALAKLRLGPASKLKPAMAAPREQCVASPGSGPGDGLKGQ